ncbi:MAG: glycosyltransferase family 39 protein [Blastocatellales bacterium]
MANLISIDAHATLIHLVSLASLSKYIVWGISHFGWLSLMLLCAFGAGSLFLRRCNFHSLVERIVFALALGMGVWALALFVLGLCGALYRPVILSLTIISALATAFHLIREARGRLSLSSLSWKECFRPGRLMVFALVVVSLAYAGLLALAAQYPPLHWDAISGHLPLARYYLEDHRVLPMRGAAFPLLPALNHLLFSWALALKDDILAQLIEYTFLMLTALGLFTWGQRQQQPGLGFAAAALWLSYPLVLWLGESAYVDVGTTCFAFLGVYALRVFWDKQESAWWLLASALFGMAAGTKMPALFFVAAGAAFGLWMLMRSRITWRELAQGWAIVLLVTIPWYGFIAYYTGNPVWPMFPQFTRVEWVSSTKETFNNLVGGGGLPKTALNFIKLPYYLGMKRLFFWDNGKGLSPVIALLPLAWIIAIWHRSVRWWVLWILIYTAYWFTFASFLRYWLPVVPLVGLALYEGLGWVMGKVSKSSVIHNAVWITLAVLAMRHGYYVVEQDLNLKGRLPITAERRDAMLTNLLTGYGGAEYINRHAQPGDTVVYIDGNYLNHYIQPRVTRLIRGILSYDKATSTLVWPTENEWVDRLEAKNTTWVLLQHDGITLPEQSPFDRPGGRLYEHVYAGSGAHVWRRTPLPPDVSRDAARLKQQDIPCSPTEVRAGDAASYNGFLDIVNCETVQGWAWDANQPNCPINVDIYDGDKLLGTTRANLLRDDLAQAGIGNGKHAFKYYISASVEMRLRDEQSHSIRAAIAGSNFTLGNSPKTLYCRRAIGN